MQNTYLPHRVVLEEKYRKGGGSLSDELIKQYDEVGYIVLDDLLDERDMKEVIESMSRKVDEIADELFSDGIIDDRHEDSPFDTRLAEIFDGLTDKDFLRFGRGWRDRLPGYYDLMSNHKILDSVESLIGPEIFSNPVYNTRPKVPGVAAGAVPWHQDKSYWPDADAIPVLTCWVPMVDTDEENGCLHIWPGTHRMRVLSYHAETRTGTAYTEVDDKHLVNVKIVPLPVRKGSAIIFNDRILHMSTPNRSEGVRWSVDLRYQPTDQDPMPGHGAGFLARSQEHPDRIVTLDDWLAGRLEQRD
jgi:phytanoyl-CoA hydroxylase